MPRLNLNEELKTKLAAWDYTLSLSSDRVFIHLEIRQRLLKCVSRQHEQENTNVFQY